MHNRPAFFKRPALRSGAVPLRPARAAYGLPIGLLLYALAAGSVSAQTFNGYRAQYERDIGPIPACDVTLSPSDSRNRIEGELNDNDNDRVFCFTAGSYQSKGAITIEESADSSDKRWLRLVEVDTTHPVKRSAGARAVFSALNFVTADNWIIHGISIDGEFSNESLIDTDDSRGLIFDRVLLQNSNASTIVRFDDKSHNNSLQNCVIRKGGPIVGKEVIGVNLVRGARIVNCELYDVASKFAQAHHGNNRSDIVIENNDLYFTPEFRFDCRGNQDDNGECMAGETFLTFKGGSVAGKEIKVIRNRFWGGRDTDNKACCDGGSRTQGGAGVSMTTEVQGEGVRHILVLQNTYWDGTFFSRAVDNGGDGVENISFIGNLIYDLNHSDSRPNTAFHALGKCRNCEVYLNTVIDTESFARLSGTSNDVKCNVFIDAGAADRSNPGSQTIWDANVYYNTDAVEAGGNLVFESTNAARHANYCFFRKRWTGPERACIPNAKPTLDSPHANACSVTLGTRQGIGVSDELL